MLRTADRDVHLHVFGPDAAEAERMLAFRDTLRTDGAARQRYERVKRHLARREWPTMQYYADAKSNTIDDILPSAESGLARLARSQWSRFLCKVTDRSVLVRSEQGRGSIPRPGSTLSPGISPQLRG